MGWCFARLFFHIEYKINVCCIQAVLSCCCASMKIQKEGRRLDFVCDPKSLEFPKFAKLLINDLKMMLWRLILFDFILFTFLFLSFRDNRVKWASDMCCVVSLDNLSTTCSSILRSNGDNECIQELSKH